MLKNMYKSFSLLELIEAVAYKGDRVALEEFHNNRRLFYCRKSRPVRLTEFVDYLCQKDNSNFCYANNDHISQGAYDLTITKFTNLPMENNEQSGEQMKDQGTNCRYYFGAFIKYVKAKIPETGDVESVQFEMKISRFLQNFVVRHFHLSCLECARRADGLTRRYIWNVDGQNIPVWMPAYMSAKQCRDWLAENISRCVYEKEAIQAVVDSFFRKNVIVSLEQNNIEAQILPDDSVLDETEGCSFADGLAAAVADEKAENIDIQRPAIRTLGREKLKKMIMQIFEAISEDRFEAQKIAERFGLSGATFSRFASNHWHHEDKPDFSTVPDLWSNTAHVLAGNNDFIETAGAAGLLGRIKQTMEVKSLQRSRPNGG
jgi:hypothetical protein